MTKTRLAVSLAGVVMCAAIVATTASAAPDQTMVRQAAREALVTVQTAGLVTPSGRAGMPSRAALTVARESAVAAVRARFSGPEQARRMRAIDQRITEQATGNLRYLGAGVTRFDVTDVSVDDRTAHVEAKVELWAKVVQVQAGGKEVMAQPRTSKTFIFDLTRVGSRWMVVNFGARFVGATGP
jgi:hypothetical protein